MAQSYSRPSYNLTDSSPFPANPTFHQIPVLRSTSPQTQVKSVAVAESTEPLHSQQGGQRGSNQLELRPTKRQKVVEDGNKHKFVSQKRWKFQDGQPWLPSRVSSKAQNASKAVNKIKQEPASPSTPLSPSSAHLAQDGQAVHVSRPVNNEKEHEHIGRSQRMLQQSKGAFSPSSEVDSKRGHGLEEKAPATTSASRPLQTRPTSKNKLQTYDNVEQCAASEKVSNDNATRDPAEITSVSVGRSRLLRSGHALSLEKDAERIAALIAEKRKENEANMFRERLLRRQLQHRTQKDMEKIMDPSVGPEANQLDSGLIAPDHNTIEKSSSGTFHQSIATSGHTRFRQATYVQHVYSKGADGSRRTVASPASSHEQVRITTSPKDVNAGLSRALSPSYTPSTTETSVQDEKETVLSNESTTKSGTTTRKSRFLGMSEGCDPSNQSLRSNVYYDTNNADIMPQPGALADHVNYRMPRRNMEVQQPPNIRHDQATQWSGGLSNPVPIGKSFVPQRVGSIPSTHAQRTRDVTAASTPSPASLVSSYSPTGPSSRQFSQINISAQPSQHTLMQTSYPGQNRPASSGQPTMGDGTYYAMGRPTWAPAEHQVGQFASTHRGVQSEAATVQQRPYMSSATATGMQQQMAQPPILTSNVNMFSGNVRSNIGNGVAAEPQKPRVNMFSNTRGTPFPMHEVIRQIEMT